MIVTGSLVTTLCRVILLCEARVANSLLDNHRFGVWTAVLDVANLFVNTMDA